MYPSPDSAEQPVDSDSSAEQPDHYCSVYSSKPPPPAQKCAVCNQACLGPVIWTKHEVPRPTCGQTCYQKTWHLQGITRGDDRDQGKRHSGFTKSSAERPAFWPEARCPPEDLRALLRERYHPPGYPKGLGDSRHLDGRIAADASRQNGFGSAEQSAPLPKAVSPVPVPSPQLNTGPNPQSGDLVPCYGAKPPPPHVHRNPLASDSPRFKAPPPNSSLPLPFAGLYHATSFIHGHRGPPPAWDRLGNRQEPNIPSKAPPRRFQLFITHSTD